MLGSNMYKTYKIFLSINLPGNNKKAVTLRYFKNSFQWRFIESNVTTFLKYPCSCQTKQQSRRREFQDI